MRLVRVTFFQRNLLTYLDKEKFMTEMNSRERIDFYFQAVVTKCIAVMHDIIEMNLIAGLQPIICYEYIVTM